MITLEEYINYTTNYGNEGFIEHQAEMIEWNKALIVRFPWLAYSNDTAYYSTWLDDMPPGWYLAFGIQMCEEIQEVLEKYGVVGEYYVNEVKEKFGALCWYDTVPAICSKEIDNITFKYVQLSEQTCCECGKPAKWMSRGWICPYCDDCRNKAIQNRWGEEHFVKLNVSKWFTRGEV